MNVTSLVFGFDGQIGRIAGTLTSVWRNVHYTKIDISDAEYDYTKIVFAPDEVCYVVFPSYDDSILKSVLEHLSQMHANRTPMVIVAVGDNLSSEDVLFDMIGQTVDMGFYPIAAIYSMVQTTSVFRRGSWRFALNGSRELEVIGMQIKAKAKAALEIHREKTYDDERKEKEVIINRIRNTDKKRKPQNILYM